jgi:hypothetical protein
MARPWCVALVAIAVLLPAAGGSRPAAQVPAAGIQHVWTAVWKHDLQDPGRPYSRYIKASIEFTGVQETRTDGSSRWLSRDWKWSYLDIYQEFGTIAYDPTVGRYAVNITKTCKGGDTLNLGPTDSSQANEGAPTLYADCEQVVTPADERGGVGSRTPSKGDVDQLPTVSAPQDGCSESSATRHVQGNSVGTSSYSLTVSGPVDAVMEVDPDGEYGRFVPVPGETLTFTARARSGTARFRFELDSDGTSHFPGYATNANIDDTFFVKHNLIGLRNGYANDAPDVIFDREHFSAQEWSRHDLSVVETRRPQTSAVVTVTVMDYGAVGKLRAFAMAEDCGDWQPVPVRFGNETRQSIRIPLDEDGNFMADALEMYRGMNPGADVDAEPKGNGMAGDGLTAFEEYRGLMTRGGDCGEPSQTFEIYGMYAEGEEVSFPGWSDEHIRSAPHQKDLFVHTPDPELVALLGNFAWSSGLSVHPICKPHYVDDDTRIVNVTLQQNGARTWLGRTLSQAAPQHGILLTPVAETQYASYGTAVPVVAGTSGPPKFTWFVEIAKSASIPGENPRVRRTVEARQRPQDSRKDLPWVVVHELAHSVGLPHHGDDIREWRDVPGRMNVVPKYSPRQRAGGPIDYSSDLSAVVIPDLLLVEPGPECRETDDTAAYMTGQFVGCLAGGIARRGQQNSGEMDCPMRYSYEDWYEPPGSTAAYLYPGLVTRTAAPTAADVLIQIDAWGGRLRRYRNDLDRLARGRLCANIRGTGINALGGDRNHAGNAGRDKPCVEFLVVNDLAASGMP